MKARVIGIVVAFLGIGGMVSAFIRRAVTGQSFDEYEFVLMAARCVLVAVGIVMTLWSFSKSCRDVEVMRLNWFLPWHRRTRAGWAGTARRLLTRLGPTVVSSPVRRGVQASCFLLFLTLFFYVCWPYSARPRPPGRVSTGWVLDEIDRQDRFRFRHPTPSDWPSGPGGRVYVVEEKANEEAEDRSVPFALLAVDDGRIVLKPDGTLSPEQFDRFLLGEGPWAFHESEPGRWPSHYTDNLARKQIVPAEIFLAIDPLVSLSSSIAARSWIWSLQCAGVVLLVLVLVPRAFCGYVCPLGTAIDIFDWAITARVKRFRVGANGWWVHIRYYLLAGTLTCALLGVMAAGYVSAIPMITRALMYLGEPLQTGTLRGWHLLVPMNAGHVVSIALFAIVLLLGFLKPRFWCKYVCPSGAIFSLGNLLRLTGRKVESTCIECGRCVEVCSFDAIKPDLTTRGTDCTFCQTCGGVCRTHSIKFVERWNSLGLKAENDPPTDETAIGRRGFLSLAAGTAAAVAGGAGLAAATNTFGADLKDPDAPRPVRPPGSVPERQFLCMCIRCGECLKVCPYNVLQPMGFDQGLEGLWTPQVVADHAGCAPSCNTCGQVCPTGAIRALPLEEKKAARMGLAIVDKTTCLPYANRRACQACVDECQEAGYEALEFVRVNTEVDDAGKPIAASGQVAPVVLAEKCVGCGLCQMSCYRVNVKKQHWLERSAIIVRAGEGREDRLSTGSYVELRKREASRREAERRRAVGQTGSEYFVPQTPSQPSEALSAPGRPNIGTPPPDDAGSKPPAPPEAGHDDPFH